jgi:hypothetical protein
MNNVLTEEKKESIASWVDHVLFDEIKQFLTTKKA